MSDFGPGYLTAIIKFTEFWLKVDQAPEETRIFCGAVERVRRDVSIAQRERDSRDTMLDSDPDIKNWIDGIIEDTEQALRSVGKLLEKFRIDIENGQKVGLSHRLKWVLSKREEFLTKSNLLTTCHQSLSSSILAMRMMGTHEGQSLAAPPAYTRTGVGLPASVTMGSAYSSIPDHPMLCAHSLTDNKELGPPIAPTSSKEIESNSLYYGAGRTEIERFAYLENDNLAQVSIPAGLHTRYLSGGPSNQERRRRRHVYFAQEDHCHVSYNSSLPTYNSGQGRSARRAVFFREMKE